VPIAAIDAASARAATDFPPFDVYASGSRFENTCVSLARSSVNDAVAHDKRLVVRAGNLCAKPEKARARRGVRSSERPSACVMQVGIHVAESRTQNAPQRAEQTKGERNEMTAFVNLLKDEQGASMAEYALLLALIAVATIGALQVLQGQIVGVFERAGDAIDTALPAS